MADNHIDFKPELYGYHGAHVLIAVIPSVGFVLQENRRFTKNRYHRLPSARRNGTNKAPIEIQQQMQDNIQWIKVRRKIN
jgi:hypothetical protein